MRAGGPAGLLLSLAIAASLDAIAAASAQAEIRVGLAVPLSGQMASVGTAMERALQAAIADANGRGGVLGQTLTLSVEDDGCATATAAGAAAQLIAQKPALVIGHPCSSAAAAAVPVYANSGVLLIAVGARHPDVTRANAKLPVPALRLAGRDDRQGAAASAWLIAHAPGRRVAIIHDRTVYARGIADGATAALLALGVTPVAVLPIVAAKHDYDTSLVALRESSAEAVLFAGYPEEAGIVLAGMVRLGLSIPLIGSDSLATAAFAQRAATAPMAVQTLLPLAPSAAEDETRGAFEAWVAAAERLGAVDPEALSNALRSAPVETRTLGEVRFDLNGDLETPAFAAASAHAGRWVIGEK